MYDAGARVADPDVGVRDAEDRLEDSFERFVKKGMDPAKVCEACGNFTRHVPPFVYYRRIAMEQRACNGSCEYLTDFSLSD